MFYDKLSSFDWFVFSFCFIASIAIIFFKQNNKSASDKNNIVEYLLMGRKLTLPLFVASLVATWYGGILGVTQTAFNKGIYNFITQGALWYISYIIFAFFVATKARKFNSLTFIELIKNIFGNKIAFISSILVYFKTLPIAYAVSFAVLIQYFIPMSYPVAIITGVLIVTLYTLYGGFRAVVLSDFIQFIIMYLSVILIIIFSIYNYGGLNFLISNLPNNYFKLNVPENFNKIIIWGLIAFSTTFLNPAFYQRCFAAKSNKTAVNGILISTVIWFSFDICTTLGAMYAKAVIPNADSLTAYLEYGLNLLPNGLRGFFLSGIVATVLSTLDSFLNISSNILFYDLKMFKRFKIRTRQQLSIIITSTITILLSFFFNKDIEGIWLTLKIFWFALIILLVAISCMRFVKLRFFTKHFQ